MSGAQTWYEKFEQEKEMMVQQMMQNFEEAQDHQ
jgi:hypothetical protein